MNTILNLTQHKATAEQIQSGAKKAMIGGAPYLMTHLAKSLVVAGIEPLFAFTLRESKEVHQPDGSVQKVAVFKHAGFVPAF